MCVCVLICFDFYLLFSIFITFMLSFMCESTDRNSELEHTFEISLLTDVKLRQDAIRAVQT